MKLGLRAGDEIDDLQRGIVRLDRVAGLGIDRVANRRAERADLIRPEPELVARRHERRLVGRHQVADAKREQVLVVELLVTQERDRGRFGVG